MYVFEKGFFSHFEDFFPCNVFENIEEEKEYIGTKLWKKPKKLWNKNINKHIEKTLKSKKKKEALNRSWTSF